MTRDSEVCEDCGEPLALDEIERGLCEECLHERERENLETNGT